MSSHSRPTPGICTKWSMTLSRVKPASSAARAIAGRSSVNRDTCSPNSSAMGDSFCLAANVGAWTNSGRTPTIAFEGLRVDDRRELALQPALDDEIQHCERVLAGALVVLSEADHGSQVVRRHDPTWREPLARPVRLARARCPDQHHEARVGE